jgi:membrane protein YdbS with pleckstrin-like domain
MTLSRESRLVRWAYFSEERIPRQTSLCVLFWRVVLLTPLKLAWLVALAVGACVALWLLGDMLLAIMHRVGVTTVVFGCFVLIVAFVGVRFASRRWHVTKSGLDASPLVQSALALKRGICPLIELID